MQTTGKGGYRTGPEVGHRVRQVFYADGEIASTNAIRAALEQFATEVTHFHNVTDCLESLRARPCHLLISNAQRPAVEGLELLRDAKHAAPSLPVVLLVDHGDIQTAVSAMKGGAIDCLQRPPEKAPLAGAIAAAFQASLRYRPPLAAPLTKAEEQVLRLVLEGKTNGQAARALHRSHRTIEVHRAHIMAKLRVSSMVDLVRVAWSMGLLDASPAP